MGVKLNLTGDEIKKAQGGGFETLPAATYGAVIYTSELKKSKSSGNPMYQIDFKITEGPAGIGRRVRGWFVLTGKGLFKLVELNKATGFPYPDKGTPAGEFEFPDADEYLGIKVLVKLDVQEYESVATERDVENGVLNSETGLPVKEEGEPVTKTQNNVAKVLEYDESKISTEDDVEERAAAIQSGSLFL